MAQQFTSTCYSCRGQNLVSTLYIIWLTASNNSISREDLAGYSDRKDILTYVRGHPHSGQNEHGWGIPMASLIVRGYDNLLVTGKPAGRMIHYIATCAKVGEAAGAAAAVSVLENTPFEGDRFGEGEKQDRII